MKMADFKALSLEKCLTKLNNHLLSLKQMEGRLEDNFKTREFDFSYSLLKKNAADLGIVVDGKNYMAYATDDEPLVQPVVDLQQDFVKTQQTLTTDEIAFVKQLYADAQKNNNEPQFVVNGPPMLVVPTMIGVKKTTGISVYVEQWERWTAFKKRHSMYSGTDLLALALEEFMQKYDDGSDS